MIAGMPVFFVDPPTAPAFIPASEQPKRSKPVRRLDPKPITPTGTQDTVAFVARTPEHGEDTNCRLEPIKLHTFPPSEMGDWLSTTARLLGIGAISGLAEVLDLTPVQVSDLRRGSASLTNDEWQEVAHRLVTHHVEQLARAHPLAELARVLVRLSHIHPGFDDSLNTIALGIDNESDGRATSYDGFRASTIAADIQRRAAGYMQSAPLLTPEQGRHVLEQHRAAGYMQPTPGGSPQASDDWNDLPPVEPIDVK